MLSLTPIPPPPHASSMSSIPQWWPSTRGPAPLQGACSRGVVAVPPTPQPMISASCTPLPSSLPNALHGSGPFFSSSSSSLRGSHYHFCLDVPDNGICNNSYDYIENVELTTAAAAQTKSFAPLSDEQQRCTAVVPPIHHAAAIQRTPTPTVAPPMQVWGGAQASTAPPHFVSAAGSIPLNQSSQPPPQSFDRSGIVMDFTPAHYTTLPHSHPPTQAAFQHRSPPPSAMDFALAICQAASGVDFPGGNGASQEYSQSFGACDPAWHHSLDTQQDCGSLVIEQLPTERQLDGCLTAPTPSQFGSEHSVCSCCAAPTAECRFLMAPEHSSHSSSLAPGTPLDAEEVNTLVLESDDELYRQPSDTMAKALGFRPLALLPPPPPPPPPPPCTASFDNAANGCQRMHTAPRHFNNARGGPPKSSGIKSAAEPNASLTPQGNRGRNSAVVPNPCMGSRVGLPGPGSAFGRRGKTKSKTSAACTASTAAAAVAAQRAEPVRHNGTHIHPPHQRRPFSIPPPPPLPPPDSLPIATHVPRQPPPPPPHQPPHTRHNVRNHPRRNNNGRQFERIAAVPGPFRGQRPRQRPPRHTLPPLRTIPSHLPVPLFATSLSDDFLQSATSDANRKATSVLQETVPSSMQISTATTAAAGARLHDFSVVAQHAGASVTESSYVPAVVEANCNGGQQDVLYCAPNCTESSSATLPPPATAAAAAASAAMLLPQQHPQQVGTIEVSDVSLGASEGLPLTTSATGASQYVDAFPTHTFHSPQRPSAVEYSMQEDSYSLIESFCEHPPVYRSDSCPPKNCSISDPRVDDHMHVWADDGDLSDLEGGVEVSDRDEDCNGVELDFGGEENEFMLPPPAVRLPDGPSLLLSPYPFENELGHGHQNGPRGLCGQRLPVNLWSNDNTHSGLADHICSNPRSLLYKLASDVESVHTPLSVTVELPPMLDDHGMHGDGVPGFTTVAGGGAHQPNMPVEVLAVPHPSATAVMPQFAPSPIVQTNESHSSQSTAGMQHLQHLQQFPYVAPHYSDAYNYAQTAAATLPAAAPQIYAAAVPHPLARPFWKAYPPVTILWLMYPATSQQTAMLPAAAFPPPLMMTAHF